MIRIITTAQHHKNDWDEIPEIPVEFDNQFKDMEEIPLSPTDYDNGVVLTNDPVPMTDDDDQDPTDELFSDLPNDNEPSEGDPEVLPEPEVPLQPSQDLSIPEPAPTAPGVDSEQLEEVDVPDIELDKLNSLPPKNQIDMVMAINVQRELGDTPMPPLMLEIDYLTLPHRTSGARRFLPKRAIKPEETKVFGTGRAIVTAWDFTKNDYRRFAISQIQRSEIKEQ